MGKEAVYTHPVEHYKETEKAWITTPKDIDESHRCDVEGKKSDTEEYLLHESMAKFKNRQKQSMMLEVRMVATHGEEHWRGIDMRLVSGGLIMSMAWSGCCLRKYIHFVRIQEAAHLRCVHFSICMLYFEKYAYC